MKAVLKIQRHISQAVRKWYKRYVADGEAGLCSQSRRPHRLSGWVLELYSRRSAANAVRFLEDRMLVEFPFPIQRIQTDRGGEFFGLAFQRALKRHHIKFRPIRPYAPHLNGKLERSQKTDKRAFWAIADLNDPQLDMRLQEWQFFYNAQRSHGGINGLTPMQKCAECSSLIPWSWEAWDDYDPKSEPERIRNYAADQALMKLKRSV